MAAAHEHGAVAATHAEAVAGQQGVQGGLGARQRSSHDLVDAVRDWSQPVYARSLGQDGTGDRHALGYGPQEEAHEDPAAEGTSPRT